MKTKLETRTIIHKPAKKVTIHGLSSNTARVRMKKSRDVNMIVMAKNAVHKENVLMSLHVVEYLAEEIWLVLK